MGFEVTETGQTTIQLAGPSLKNMVIPPLGAYIWPERLGRGYNQLVGAIQNIGPGTINFNVYFSPDPVTGGWTLVETIPVAAGAREEFVVDVKDENVRLEAIEVGGALASVILNANLVPISAAQESNPAPIPVNATLNTLTTTHHAAAVAAAVGASAAIAEYSNGLIQIVSGAITSGTVVFQTSQDGTNWVDTVARNIATGVIASETELAGITNEIWEIAVAGAALLRANITALVPAASSVTITSKVTTGSAASLLGTATGAGVIDASVQRVNVATDILVENCDAVGVWAAALAAANLATDLNHILGTNSLLFDKAAGNVLAYIENAGIAVDASGFNPSDVLSCAFRIPDLTDVVYAFIRLGTDGANYNEWRVPVAEIEAAEWQIWTPTIGSQVAFLGNGADLSNVQYVAFGVEFAAAGDLLADIRVDHIYLRKILNTGAQINAEITSHIDSADINLHEVAGVATSVGAGATAANSQRVASNVHDGAGNPALDADPLPVEVGDGTNQLDIALRAIASVANGILDMVEHNAVPPVVADGQTVPKQSDAYGHPEGAAFDRSLGANRDVEQAPPQYDILRGTARADAVLPAAGAYDAAAIEIPTGGRQFLKLWFAYTRGGAGGSFRERVETANRQGGVDEWGRPSVINPAVFAAGADSNAQIQREDWSYQATGAAEETPTSRYDLGRADKFRIPCRELGNVGAPGDLRIKYTLYNE